MQETWVQALCQEDPLEKEMATHSSILDWRISWTKEPGRLQSMWLQRVGHDSGTKPPTIHGICLSYHTDMKGPLRFLISCILVSLREFDSMNLNCKSLHTMPCYPSSNL